MKRTTALPIFLWTIWALGVPARAAFTPQATAVPGSAPQGINYQGRLEDNNSPVTGTKQMVFRVYDAATGGNLLWTNPAQAVSVTMGLFNVPVPVPISALVGGGARYLEVQIDGTLMAPRELLNSVPYALIAKSIEGTLDVSTAGLSISANPSATAPSIFISSFTGSVGVGTSSPSTLFQVGGGTLAVTAAGNVGIGTTSPSRALEIQTANAGLQIGVSDTNLASAARIDLGRNGTYANELAIFRYNSGAPGTTYGISNADLAVIDQSAVGPLAIGADSPSGFLAFATAGSERMRAASSGYIGIGTTNPQRLLHVNGAVTLGTDAAAPYPLAVYQGGGGLGDAMLYIRNTTTNQTANVLMYAVDSGAVLRGSMFGFNPNNQQLFFGNNAANPRMVINESGNVGVGTTSPDQALSVFGTGKFDSLHLRYSGGGAAVITQDSANNRMNFYTTGGTPMLTINNAGNVGISTTSPASKLTVLDGDIRISTTTGSRGIFFQDGTAQTSAAGSNVWAINVNDVYNTNTGGVGIGTTSPAAKLDVAGGVKIANDAAACGSTKAGEMRFNGTNFQVCKSNAWQRFATDSTQAAVYSYTGADQTYTVPAGVTSITVKMWGAGGGGGNSGGWLFGFPGGAGGFTSGTIAVTPAQVLTVMVGGGGLNGSTVNLLPSYGGGARSCNTGVDCQYGGQGGGRSAIRTAAAVELLTAGGGGGGGSSRIVSLTNIGGAGGGLYGGYGTSDSSATGKGMGGTQTAGGAGGTGANGNGSNGAQFAGGNPASNAYGGGGGGGWYGGGGGAYGEPNTMGGAGGGSGYVNGAGVSNAVTIGGSSMTPPETRDYHYAPGIGVGGEPGGSPAPIGGNGLVVITPN